MENKRAHLEMIQGVINRMAGNSFLLKGWTITLVAALFALAQKESNPMFMYLAYFPSTVFWALDAYYLRQERRKYGWLWLRCQRWPPIFGPRNAEFKLGFQAPARTWVALCLPCISPQ
jgi:hypothetical protein